MQRLVRPLLYLIVLAAVAVAITVWRGQPIRPSAPAEQEAPVPFSSHRIEVMHTAFEVTLPEREGVAEAVEAVFDVFAGVEERMNEWREDSPLGRVNLAAGKEPVPVPEDLRAVLHRGIAIGDLTGGAFDVTWAALWGLWDFRAESPRVPAAADIAARVSLIDFRAVQIDDDAGTVQLPREGMKIGLGGIAKGYALDEAARELRRRGFADFLIVGGGQVMAGGSRDGRPWRVGIRDPRGGPEDYFATVQIADASLSTSGDYERYFEADGVRYHHILDPATGMPARGLRSATVLSSDATLADALSTAFLVLGKDRSLALADSLPGVDAVLVDEHGGVHATEGIRDRLVVHHPPRPE